MFLKNITRLCNSFDSAGVCLECDIGDGDNNMWHIKAILRDLLVSAPSICILLDKFYIVYINQWNIKNRQYVVNMKAIGVVVMTQSAITFPLPGSR